VKKIIGYILCVCLSLNVFLANIYAQALFPDKEPIGTASLSIEEHKISLQNRIISLSILINRDKIIGVEVHNRINDVKFKFSAEQLFHFFDSTGKIMSLSDLRLQNNPKNIAFTDGKHVHLRLAHPVSSFLMEWRLVLGDDQNFIRQFLEIRSDHEINEIVALPISSDYNPTKIGRVDGSPLIAGDLFWAIENPLFNVDQDAGVTTLSVMPFDVRTSLADPHLYKETFAIGAYPKNQLRRAFSFYLDKIRAKPYRPITFYDSWYDLSYDLNVLTEDACMERVKVWGDSLQKRSLHLDYFLWDSGWDDWNNMWNFNPELPHGFKKIEVEAKKYGSKMGAWLSPWGGYSPFLKVRLDNTRKHYKIFRIDEEGEHNLYKGLSLTDPNYYSYFKSVMFDLIENHGVRLFKIDGMGPGKDANGAGKYRHEMQALIHLVKEVRTFAPDVYINLTVGTWPSPFWLCYADNIWKGGDDYGFIGEGNTRQRWMNFRDLGILKGVKERAPLCPISSAMLHGITNADLGPIAKYETDDPVIEQDIWSFFASGTSLQELYINPHKLSSYSWDVLAKAMRWSKDHKDVLIDANWVGGDPSEGEIYGYAAWGGERSTLMLRNPSSKQQEYAFRLVDVLELPVGYDGHYDLYDVVKERNAGVTHSDKPFKIKLKPFEVVVLNLTKK